MSFKAVFKLYTLPPPTSKAQPNASAPASSATNHVDIADMVITSLDTGVQVMKLFSELFLITSAPSPDASKNSWKFKRSACWLLEAWFPTEANHWHPQTMTENKKCATELIANIWQILQTLADVLRKLENGPKTIAGEDLKKDFFRYRDENVLKAAVQILEEWTTEKFLKRLLHRNDFPAIANNIQLQPTLISRNTGKIPSFYFSISGYLRHDLQTLADVLRKLEPENGAKTIAAEDLKKDLFRYENGLKAVVQILEEWIMLP
ncbi:hypothetical protein C8F01DRAFT_1091365 [Mycena amicta]|nr:hypothetical protein C8F01DRAFT_1091365 [Mycena amicta]